jgi:DNA topoisomerase VI subunit A
VQGAHRPRQDRQHPPDLLPRQTHHQRHQRKTFDDQAESDPIIEDLEVAIDSLREELHVFASNRGNLAGPVTLVDAGNTLDCAAMGSAGYAVPSICEPDVIQFKKCNAKFILHVEKDTVWRRFHEDRFWEQHACIISHGGGQPARGMRRLLRRMHDELKLPVFVLLDNDPWGYYIYSVIKHGSINLAYESRRMAIPDAKFIGVSSFDYERCDMSDDVKIELDQNDIKRARQIAAYPWFADKNPGNVKSKNAQKRLQDGSRGHDLQRPRIPHRPIRPHETKRQKTMAGLTNLTGVVYEHGFRWTS